MTSPLHDPESSNHRRNWLLRYLGVQSKYDSIIATALLDASDDAGERIKKLVGDERVGSSTRRYQIQLARRSVRDVINILFRDLGQTIREGQSNASLAALEAGFQDDRKILNRLFRNRSDRGRWEDSMRQSATRGVQSMMTRVLGTSQPLSKRVYNTRALATGQVDRIINSHLVSGGSPYEIAKAVSSSIDPNVPGGIGYAAKRLGRTEVNNAFHAQAISDVQDKPWVNSAKWHLSKVHIPHPGDKCEVYAGNVFNKLEVPRKPHPQCVTGDTLVEFSGGRPIAATSRWHSGEIIEIHYSSGRNLAITPNHPILTTTGMIPAAFITKGSRIISSIHRQRERFGTDPYPQHIPSLAKDVFASFDESINMVSSVVRSMPQDFHGDVSEGDVAIVRSNIETCDSFAPDSFGQHGVDRADVFSFSEFQFGSFASFFEGLLSSSTSSIRSRSDFLEPFLGSSFSPELLRLFGSSECNSFFGKPFSKGQSFDGKTLGPADFIWRHPGQIEVDEVVGIRRCKFDGQVYNFQTELGWYTANNTVVKNCMCFITPVMDDWDSVEANILAGLFDSYIDEHL